MAYMVFPVIMQELSLHHHCCLKNNYIFRCMVCGQVLSGEYMGKDGQPYCEKGIARRKLQNYARIVA